MDCIYSISNCLPHSVQYQHVINNNNNIEDKSANALPHAHCINVIQSAKRTTNKQITDCVGL